AFADPRAAHARAVRRPTLGSPYRAGPRVPRAASRGGGRRLGVRALPSRRLAGTPPPGAGDGRLPSRRATRAPDGAGSRPPVHHAEPRPRGAAAHYGDGL